MAAVLLHCRSCCNHQTRSRGGDAQRHLDTAANEPCDIQASLVGPFPKEASVLSDCSSPSLQSHTCTPTCHLTCPHSLQGQLKISAGTHQICLLHSSVSPSPSQTLSSSTSPCTSLLSHAIPPQKSNTDASLLLFLFILVMCKSC